MKTTTARTIQFRQLVRGRYFTINRREGIWQKLGRFNARRLNMYGGTVTTERIPAWTEIDEYEP